MYSYHWLLYRLRKLYNKLYKGFIVDFLHRFLTPMKVKIKQSSYSETPKFVMKAKSNPSYKKIPPLTIKYFNPVCVRIREVYIYHCKVLNHGGHLSFWLCYSVHKKSNTAIYKHDILRLCLPLLVLVDSS